MLTLMPLSRGQALVAEQTLGCFSWLPAKHPALAFFLCRTSISLFPPPPLSSLLVTRTHCFLFHLKYLQKEIGFLLCFLYLYKKKYSLLTSGQVLSVQPFLRNDGDGLHDRVLRLSFIFFGEKEDIASSSVIWLKGIEMEEYEWDKCERFMT